MEQFVSPDQLQQQKQVLDGQLRITAVQLAIENAKNAGGTGVEKTLEDSGKIYQFISGAK